MQITINGDVRDEEDDEFNRLSSLLSSVLSRLRVDYPMIDWDGEVEP
jgi:hypothetical protein